MKQSFGLDTSFKLEKSSNQDRPMPTFQVKFPFYWFNGYIRTLYAQHKLLCFD